MINFLKKYGDLILAAFIIFGCLFCAFASLEEYEAQYYTIVFVAVIVYGFWKRSKE